MNERIIELAEKAIKEKLTLDEFITELKKSPHDFYGFRLSELEAFTELVVRECISKFDQSRAIQNVGTITHTQVINQIKNHFGVQE